MFEKCNFIRFKELIYNAKAPRVLELPFNIVKSIERSCPGMSIILKDGREILTEDEPIEFITEKVSEMVIQNIIYKEVNAIDNTDISNKVHSLFDSYKGLVMSETNIQALIFAFKSLLYNNKVLISGSIVAIGNPLDQSIVLALTKAEDLRLVERVGISLPVYFCHV